MNARGWWSTTSGMTASVPARLSLALLLAFLASPPLAATASVPGAAARRNRERLGTDADVPAHRGRRRARPGDADRTVRDAFLGRTLPARCWCAASPGTRGARDALRALALCAASPEAETRS